MAKHCCAKFKLLVNCTACGMKLGLYFCLVTEGPIMKLVVYSVINTTVFQMLSEFEDEQNKFVKMQQRRQGKLLLYRAEN